MKARIASTTTSKITLLVTAGLAVCSATAQSLPPGTTAYSPGVADDKTSWQTFISVVKPAPKATPPWPAGTLVFETWATDNDTYGTNPPRWPSSSNPPSIRFQQSALGLHGRGAVNAAQSQGAKPGAAGSGGLPGSVTCNAPGNAAAGNFPTPAVASPPANCAAEEVRRNKLAFDYITRAPGLFTPAQLAANFKSGKPISFPQSVAKGVLTNAALEVKVDWVPVGTVVTWLNNNKAVSPPATAQFVQQNYFVTTDSAGNQYAMLSMHLSLKDRPNWLWSTFEHQWNVGRCDTMGCYDKFGMPGNLAAIAPNANANQPYPVCSTKTPALKRLLANAGLGAVWNNYCLKSTQTQYTIAGGTRPPKSDAAVGTGAPLAVLSGDSVVERIVANVPIATSSCITCHAYAAFTANGCIAGSNPGLQPGAGPIGTPKPQAGQKQYDFVWGFITMNGAFCKS
jgi:hypothetical protein